MSGEKKNYLNGDIAEQLENYGRWLDASSSSYLRDKESGVDFRLRSRNARNSRGVKIIAAVAAAVLIVVGSFVVNQFGGSSNAPKAALAWSAIPLESSDETRQVVIEACERANPEAKKYQDVRTAIDIRGSLAVMVWILDSTVDVCLATLGHDQPGGRAIHNLALKPSQFGKKGTDQPAVQVLAMRSESQDIVVVVGRDDVLPADCRNLEVFTSKGIVYALRASGIFAFWYPGAPKFLGSSATTIQYGCAADTPGGAAGPKSTLVGADPIANLCSVTLDALANHGVINERGEVVNLDRWDMAVYEEFQRQVWPIAETLDQNSKLWRKWMSVNNGGALALDKSGAQKMENRKQELMMAGNAIVNFVSYCRETGAIPSEPTNPLGPTTTLVIREMNPTTQTTLEIHEMNPVTEPTVQPG